VKIALVVLISVLVVECAKVLKCHVLSTVVRFVSNSVDYLADSSCMQTKGSDSSYESWEMSEDCMSCVVLSVGG
jgi:transcription elongation factor GreA-like protein